MKKDSKIYIAGHNGLVGSAILRELKRQEYGNIIFRSREELDLCSQAEAEKFFAGEKPEYVFLAAARVGGIGANQKFPADFIRDNLLIESNVISTSHKYGVKKLLFLGSSCIYPKLAPQPIKEEYLLTGPLETTNKAYAVAKIAGIIMCQSYAKQYGANFISAMPTNLYGPGDNFDLESSHVLPAMIRKFYEAKEKNVPEVALWGTGKPRREFLHVDDLANACVFLMQNYDDPEIINLGTGQDVSISELAEMVKKIIGYEGAIKWDTSKPDGAPRKLLDVSKIHTLGWRHKIKLEDGIKITYEWFLRQYGKRE